MKSSAEQNSTDVSAESGKNGIATVFRLTVISAALLGAGNSYAVTAGRGRIAADSDNAVAISNATATGTNSVAINRATATNTDTIAIGSNANAATIGAIAIGRDTGVNVSGGPNDSTANNITIGHTARAGDDNITRVRDLCKIPFSPDSRNLNTGFRLFLFQISTDFTQIPP
mgnify:CR=1 FL=1